MSNLRRSTVALIPAALAAALGGCVPLGQGQAPAAMHDIKLLTTYGGFYDNNMASESWRKDLENEAQARGLLKPQDVMLIQDKKFVLGGSKAATIAVARYNPKAFGTSPAHPGVEVIIYDSGLYQAKDEDLFFFSGGKLIGWNYSVVNGDPQGKSTWTERTNVGTTFDVGGWQISPCQALGNSPCSGLQVAPAAGPGMAVSRSAG